LNKQEVTMKTLKINIDPIEFRSIDFKIGGISDKDWNYIVQNINNDFSEEVQSGVYEMTMERIVDLLQERNNNEKRKN
tara:strand:+ start:1323 stop:1556 length:234 start_codon:yes stop_codon:yes gene_type:complete